MHAPSVLTRNYSTKQQRYTHPPWCMSMSSSPMVKSSMELAMRDEYDDDDEEAPLPLLPLPPRI